MSLDRLAGRLPVLLRPVEVPAGDVPVNQLDITPNVFVLQGRIDAAGVTSTLA